MSVESSGPPIDNPSTERLLRAASPAISAELTRIVEELRERLEAEATVRLKKALLDRETELQAESKEAQERARAETATEVTGQVTAQLEQRFKSKLASELQALKDRLRQEAETKEQSLRERGDHALSEWKSERTQLAEETQRWRALSEFHRRVGEASSQIEILRRFLHAAEQFSSGVALYLDKEDGLALWNSEGDATPFPEVISEETKDPEWFWASVVIRSKAVAAVCASGVSDPESLNALIEGLRRAIEYLGLRMQILGSSEPLEASGAESVQPEASDARRLARTLVSGIKLGHEQAVAEGRARFDLYARLQKEIDEGRQAYLRQLPSPAPEQDFFHDEVVKILADNDPGRLGDAYPGPV